ncbi:MAG: transporter ATP-binding protein [Actinomycetia bacterium]|nr:transporter ATP-binding protein [Actinomycetes bacterium]
MPEIAVDALSMSFGTNQVLDNVSFTVHEREFLTLLGPSGCGKTTTLMSVAGFLRPDSGRISCGTQAFYDHAAKIYLAAEDRNLGIVFQSYAIWPHMTVFENVAFPLKVRKVKGEPRRRRVMETLGLVEMADYAARYPHELSGGQQQRVALARALVYSPSVLLLDEPFSNLDAKLRERARTWLMGLQRDLGLTTLFVTHDQDEALSLSDRIVVMNKGSILQVGPPEEIYRRPDHRFVAEFLGHCNIFTGHVTHVQDQLATVQLDTTQQRLTLPVGAGAPGDQIDVVVRPEAIILSEDLSQLSQGVNTYRAKVRSRAFLGDHYVYELELAGLPLTVTHPTAFSAAELTVHIPVEACRAMTNHTETTLI